MLSSRSIGIGTDDDALQSEKSRLSWWLLRPVLRNASALRDSLQTAKRMPDTTSTLRMAMSEYHLSSSRMLVVGARLLPELSSLSVDGEEASAMNDDASTSSSDVSFRGKSTVVLLRK